MKTFALSLTLIALSLGLHAQQPVHWSYSVKKIAPLKYQVALSAQIEKPWHTYSQSTPDGGPVGTSISFTKNPIVELVGLPKEIGQLKQVHDEAFDVDVKYFQDQVSFVEEVDLKADVKVTLTGKIHYMACNDEQCLPPSTENFSVQLGGN